MSNTDNMQAEQVGTLTRITIGSPPTATSPLSVQHMANKVGGGAVRYNMGQGTEPSQAGVARYTVGQDASTHSVMATLQRVNGADTVELIPGVPASRTHVRQALADGLIEPVGGGQYRDKGGVVSASESGAPAEAKTDGPASDPGAGVFDAAEDAEWAAAIEPLSQHGYDAAASAVTVAVLSGSGLETAAKRLSESEAMPMEQAVRYVSEGHAMYEHVVAKEVASVGVQDKEGFYLWCRNTQGKALQHAMQSLVEGRDVSRFRNLALQYASRAPANRDR